jgi:hypothetical protein
VVQQRRPPDDHERLGAMTTTMRNRLSAALVLVGLSALLDPLLLNLQLWDYGSARFPTPYFAGLPFVGSAVCMLLACAHLLYRCDRFPSGDWWFAFAVVMVPYVWLKWIGVYHDLTVYLIARDEGRHIGGGAAMGHVWLGFYVFGPAALVSWIALQLGQIACTWSPRRGELRPPPIP